ncbi:hypothetical protein GZL_05851 [Streptomyces sp. 769]|nr:hypothetical protein GZL_05851 [Streptomyces sp. 769]
MPDPEPVYGRVARMRQGRAYRGLTHHRGIRPPGRP